MKLVWITIGDNRVCPDCVARDRVTKTDDEWESEGLPREGFTRCGDLCRCDLIPDDIVGDASEEILDELPEGITDEDIKRIVIDELFSRIRFDKTSGRALLLKDFKSVIGLKELDYWTAAKYSKRFDRMTGLIYRYNTEIGTLPAEYYAILDIDGKIAWLKGVLE
jgi:hypothetical protein